MTTTAYVRVKPDAVREVDFVCGFLFTKTAWKTVDVDAATLLRLQTEGGLEVSLTAPSGGIGDGAPITGYKMLPWVLVDSVSNRAKALMYGMRDLLADMGVPFVKTDLVTGKVKFDETLRKSLFIAGLGDSHTNGQMWSANSATGSTAIINLPPITPRDHTFDGANGILGYLKLASFLGDITGSTDPNLGKSTSAVSYLNFVPQNIRAANCLIGDITLANFGVGGSSAFTWAGEAARAYVHAVANAQVGDTVTVDGVTYTFVAAAASPNEVTIAGTANATSQNLSNAINAEGTGFGAGTVAHPTCYCPTPTATAYQVIAAKFTGVAGNSLSVQSSTTARLSACGEHLVDSANAAMYMGSDTSALYANMKTLLGANIPDCFPITLGTNDASRVGYRAVGMQAELTKIVAHLHADFPSAKIVFVPPPRTTASALTNATVDTVVVPAIAAVVAANPSFVSSIDTISLGAGTAGIFEVTNLSGGIHCSNYGYLLWATLLAKKVCTVFGL